MIKQCRRVLLAAATGATFLLAGGCAAPTNMTMMDDVRDTADEAMRTANAAGYEAQLARQMADQTMADLRRVMKRLGMQSLAK